MNLKIKKKIFDKSLSNIAKALNVSSPLSSLQGLLITANESNIQLIASNGNLSIKEIIEAHQFVEIVKPGKILVPGRLFREIIKKQDEEIELLVTNNQLEVISLNNKTNLNLFNVQDYPTINFESFGKELIVNVENFQSMIKNVAFAAAIDDKRIILNGVNLIAKNKILTMSATNSFRLAQETYQIDSSIDFNISIFSKNLRDFIPATATGEIKIAVNDTKIITTNKNTTIVSNLIDGIYPDVSKLIPQDFIGKLEINKNELDKLIDKATVLAPESLQVVKMIINNGELILKSKRDEIGETVVKYEKFTWQGIDKFVIVFNARFFKEAINKFSGQISLNFNGSQKPIVIKSFSNPNLIQLILPHRSY